MAKKGYKEVFVKCSGVFASLPDSKDSTKNKTQELPIGRTELPQAIAQRLIETSNKVVEFNESLMSSAEADDKAEIAKLEKEVKRLNALVKKLEKPVDEDKVLVNNEGVD